MHYIYKKARCGPEIATFRTKTPHFFRVKRLNWLAKIELRGARGPWSSVSLLVTVICKKCSEETETEEAIGFFVTFLSLMKFKLRGAGPPPPSLGYAYAPIEANKKDICKFSARFLAFSNKISTVKKNRAVLEPKTGQFSRT